MGLKWLISYVMSLLIFIAISAGVQLPPAVEADKLKMPIRYVKGEKIR